MKKWHYNSKEACISGVAIIVKSSKDEKNSTVTCNSMQTTRIGTMATAEAILEAIL